MIWFNLPFTVASLIASFLFGGVIGRDQTEEFCYRIATGRHFRASSMTLRHSTTLPHDDDVDVDDSSRK